MKRVPIPCAERRHPSMAKTCPSPSSVSQSICQIRVLIADDQELVRVGLRTMLKDEPDLLIVSESGSLTDMVSETQRVQPDIVLLQYRLADGPGSEVYQALFKANPEARVIALSLENTGTAFRHAIEAGANGYLLVGVTRQELLRAIRAVARGNSYIDTEAIHHGFAALRGREEAVPFDHGLRLPHVSPRERQILPFLSEGKTNKEIAVELSLSDKTVKNYLAHMFKKLRVRNRAHAAATFVRGQKRVP